VFTVLKSVLQKTYTNFFFFFFETWHANDLNHFIPFITGLVCYIFVLVTACPNLNCSFQPSINSFPKFSEGIFVELYFHQPFLCILSWAESNSGASQGHGEDEAWSDLEPWPVKY